MINFKEYGEFDNFKIYEKYFPYNNLNKILSKFSKNQKILNKIN